MATPQQLKAESERLHKELGEVERELQTARAALTDLASQRNADPKQSEQTAARVMVLDARKTALEAAIRNNDALAKRHEDLIKSKEYKDAMKQIADLAKFFVTEADDIHNELYLMRQRLQTAVEKCSQYEDLIYRYCVDLDTVQQNSKARNKDAYYLLGVLRMIAQMFNDEAIVKSFERASAETIARRNNPVEKITQAVKETIRTRQSKSDGTPILESGVMPHVMNQ